jgi:HMG (high mobility group) box
LTFGEVGARLGELWKSLTDDEKAPYHEQSAADKVRVAALKAEMDRSSVDAAKKDDKNQKPKKLDISAKLKATKKAIITNKRARDVDENENDDDADAGEDAGQEEVSKKARKAAREAAAKEEKAKKAAAKKKAAENKWVRELFSPCWLIAHLWLLLWCLDMCWSESPGGPEEYE